MQELHKGQTMTHEDIEAEIGVLLAQASELRALAEDDPHKLPLGALIDRINALRAMQDKNMLVRSQEVERSRSSLQEIDPDAPIVAPKVRLGRPPRAIV
jgi:hypothetical protein